MKGPELTWPVVVWHTLNPLKPNGNHVYSCFNSQ